MMFECKAGRVTLIDTAGAASAIMRRESKGQAEQLRNAVVGDGDDRSGRGVPPALHARARAVGPGGAGGRCPVDGAFRYRRTRWEVEPVAPDRGEPGDKALAAGSEFRKVVDAIDAKTTAVTLWVYPDSFALYRRLRDYLHDRDVVVAGRPLPEGVPIASSSQGTVSRGQ